MSQTNWQKIKLLKLVELLRQDTDEAHPMTTRALCDAMIDMGIPCDRRTLSVDIDLLNESGIEVLSCRVGKSKAYYIEDRSFSVPELKILMDAVQASGCITEKKSVELIGKIAALGGTHTAQLLKRNAVAFNPCKHSNESVYYNIDELERAISRGKRITFRYFDLDIKAKRSYRYDGKIYETEPVALVYNEDNYYLIAYSAKYGKVVPYRVDRMDQVCVQREKISEAARAARKEVGKYRQQTFRMFRGEAYFVTLEFDPALIGVVFDRFGESIRMKETPEGKISASVRVQLSPTFWGWVFQFGRQMRVVSPTAAVEDYRRRVAELMD